MKIDHDDGDDNLLIKAASMSSRSRIVLRGRSATRACRAPSVMSPSARLPGEKRF